MWNPGKDEDVVRRADAAGREREEAASRVGWSLAGIGIAGSAAAVLASASDAKAAASQDWPPFVLVGGLLLIGWVAEQEGLFAIAGHRIARLTTHGAGLFVGSVAVVAVVTALLNLDTSVAFLTPVLIYTARSRGMGEQPMLYGALLLSNAGSLFLPGSNLTNLIVLGHVRISGTTFLADMWAPALAALVVTAVVVAIAGRHELRATSLTVAPAHSPGIGIGLVSVLVATVIVLVVQAPALPVAAVGVVAVGIQIARRPEVSSRVLRTVDVPLLVGLLGIAVTLGALGRAWSGPATLLSHLDAVGSAAVGAVAAIAVNNLPAASLLAARTPKDPFALLVGLNLGPNLCVTGSLAWLLWLKAARSAGARPSLRSASKLGIICVPLSMAAALAVLAAMGAR
jgi:arsenical pump membrane protein